MGQLHNPFYTRELPLSAPFCNRVNELGELTRHAQNKMNIVLYSPRRYGKTSLIKRVLDKVSKTGMITVYADMYGVTSQEDIADRIVKAIYKNNLDKKKLLASFSKWLFSWRLVAKVDDKPGMSFALDKVAGRKEGHLIEEVFRTIDKISKTNKEGCCVVLDEFQEITEIKNSMAIEGLMRSFIQQHSNTAYVFVGSRRTLLKDMFNEKKRPFYRSATNYELKPLPDTDLLEYIVMAFKHGGKECPKDEAKKIVDLVNGYAYYAQKISYCIYERSGAHVIAKNVSDGLDDFFEDERPYFEMMLSKIPVQQIRLLNAIAKEPTQKPFGNEYIIKHKLGSLGAIQGGIKHLTSIDYIQKREGYYEVVDPLFKMWLIKNLN